MTDFKSLAPGFLIASPPLGDPNFDRTVVLLAVHSAEGALGFVVNRLAPLNLGELLDQAGYEGVGKSDAPVWLGGPVQPHSGWVIVDDSSLSPSDSLIGVGDRLRVSSSRSAFDTLAAELRCKEEETVPRPRLVVLGYSGWGPEQLESEIARGAWLPVPLAERILFDVDVNDRWEKAYGLLGLSPTHLMTMNRVGKA